MATVVRPPEPIPMWMKVSFWLNEGFSLHEVCEWSGLDRDAVFQIIREKLCWNYSLEELAEWWAAEDGE